MRILKVFTDISVDDESFQLLKSGVAPHEVVLRRKPVSSPATIAQPQPTLGDADIAFGQPGIEEILAGSQLRWVHLSSAGYTRYDTMEFRKAMEHRKTVLTTSSDIYAEACAEHVLAFMLAQSRRLPEALKTGYESGGTARRQVRRSCALLKGQTVVILGFGSIARKLLALLHPFEMKIVAVRRRPKGDEGVFVITPKDLLPALSVADHVVNLLPANEESARFMAVAQFAAMKQGAVFYNIGRGDTVDQAALSEALRSGHLNAAWLDVTDPEPLPESHSLLSAPNCFFTPHTGGGQQNESAMLIQHFLENFRRFIKESPLLDRVI